MSFEEIIELKRDLENAFALLEKKAHISKKKRISSFLSEIFESQFILRK